MLAKAAATRAASDIAEGGLGGLRRTARAERFEASGSMMEKKEDE